jgi:hypothetical protein
VQAFEVPIEGLPEVKLTWKISAIANPDGVRSRAKAEPDAEALEVVLDRLTPNGRIDVREAAVLVRQTLIGLILKRIRVHRFDEQSARLGEHAQHRTAVGTIPRDVQ